MLNRLISEIRYRLRALFRRGRLEQELDAELSFHLEKEAEKLSAMGYSPEEPDAERTPRSVQFRVPKTTPGTPGAFP